MLVKELITADGTQYRCRISGKLFADRATATNHALRICRRQFAAGVPPMVSIRDRAKLYRSTDHD